MPVLAGFTMEGLGAFTMTLSDTRSVAVRPAENTIAFWHETPDGFVVRRADIEFASQNAVGTLQVPAGSWIAEWAGGTSFESRFFVGKQSYTHGFVDL